MLICLVAATVVSCSTKKNTASTRFWHAFTAKYNIYYNGTLAYIDASVEKEKGNKDNYTEFIPLYTVGNKGSRELGKANYDIAITKAEKAIQLHSIKAKPVWNKDRRKTDHDIEWLNRKEYNPFLWKAWMLMGRSQFYKGDFDEAAATFTYMSRLYKGQPVIYGKARAWLAKCYIENDWLYDAEDVIRNMQRDSIDWRAQKEWDYTLCDYYLHTGDLNEAAKYLQRVIKHEMRPKQKAREYYLLGQIEAAQQNNSEAYKAFKKVLKQHPSYELRFNANIALTEVMAKGQSKKMIGRLRRMARDDNNSEYLDQVYYAIGNIYLADKDTLNAISAYEKGNSKAIRSGIEKGVLLLHLGDLYWTMEKYTEAKRCYGEAIGLLDKDRKDYAQLSERSKVLDELVPYTDAIHLQDSLLALSYMPTKERNAAIDRVIDNLKRKEKEEARDKAEKEIEEKRATERNNNIAANNIPLPNTGSMGMGGTDNTVWYFYNPTAVQQGKQTFERIWGKRENKDNWQRKNKTVVGDTKASDADEYAMDTLTDAQRDSISMAQALQEAQNNRMDSAVNDPHKREYYLAQIPFSNEQRAASNNIIRESLLKSAIIFKDKLNNLTLSEKAFNRLEEQYPEMDPKDEMYYHLFLLHSRKDEHDKANDYVDKLRSEYPESKWTITVTDPFFYENARYGKHIEDSIYNATYEAFKSDRLQEVYDNALISEKRFPLGANRDRFIFFYGMAKLNDGDIKACRESMETIIKDYPQSSVSEMAGMIINGVKAGKRLYGAKFDLTNVWDRRTGVMDETDSLTAKSFTDDRNAEHLFVFAYTPDSLNENQLLYQLAKYNFTSFMVRNFDITIDNAQGMHHMTVSGFRNLDEARQYAKVLSAQASIRNVAKGARTIIISKENLDIIGQRYSYNDYDTFYVHHYSPLEVTKPEQLYEPVTKKQEIRETPSNGNNEQPKREKYDEEGNIIDDDPVKPILPTEDVAPGGAKPVEPSENDDDSNNDDSNIIIPKEEDIILPQEDSIIAPEDSEEHPTQQQEDTIVIPQEKADETPTQQQEDTIVIPQEKADETPALEEGSIVIEDEKDNAPSNGDDTIIFDEQQKEELPDSNDSFIIDDGNSSKKEDTGDSDTYILEEDKKSLDAIEDEYYELDGF